MAKDNPVWNPEDQPGEVIVPDELERFVAWPITLTIGILIVAFASLAGTTLYQTFSGGTSGVVLGIFLVSALVLVSLDPLKTRHILKSAKVEQWLFWGACAGVLIGIFVTLFAIWKTYGVVSTMMFFLGTIATWVAFYGQGGIRQWRDRMNRLRASQDITIRNGLHAVNEMHSKIRQGVATRITAKVDGENAPLTGSFPSGGVRFFGPKSTLSIGDASLEEPLIYATGKKSIRAFDPSVIDASLPVARTVDESNVPQPPLTYRTLSPGQRARYIKWLIEFGADPSMPIPYVYLYFYGLERRVVSENRDHKAVIMEITRLLDHYGKHAEFRDQAEQLIWLAAVQSLDKKGVARETITQVTYATRVWSGSSLRNCLAYHAAKELPIPGRLAFHVASECLMDAPLEHVEWYRDAFIKHYEHDYGKGIRIQPVKQLHKVEYRPANPLLGKQMSRIKARRVSDVLANRDTFKDLKILWDKCVVELESLVAQKEAQLEVEAREAEAREAEARESEAREAEAAEQTRVAVTEEPTEAAKRPAISAPAWPTPKAADQVEDAQKVADEPSTESAVSEVEVAGPVESSGVDEAQVADEKVDEVASEPAEPDVPSEKDEASEPAATDDSSSAESEFTFSLDMSAVSRIMAETREVSSVLQDAMDDEDEDEVEGEGGEEDEDSQQKHDIGEGLSDRVRPFFDVLITKDEWAEDELTTEARSHSLMLGGAIEMINEWSQERFGDWLVEEGDPIYINMELIGQ